MQESYYKGYSPRNMEEDEDHLWRDASDPYCYPTLDHIGEAKGNSTNPTQINNLPKYISMFLYVILLQSLAKQKKKQIGGIVPESLPPLASSKST